MMNFYTKKMRRNLTDAKLLWRVKPLTTSSIICCLIRLMISISTGGIENKIRTMQPKAMANMRATEISALEKGIHFHC